MISERDRVLILTTMAAGLRAGMSLTQVLDYLESTVRTDAASLVRDTKARIESGLALSQAAFLAPSLFLSPLPSAIGVAERLGNLPQTLERLARSRARTSRRRARTMMSLVYPLSMLALGIPAVWLAATVLLPQIAASVRSMGQDLPAPTLMLMEAVNALGRSRFVVAAVTAAVVALCWIRRREAREFLWSMPIIGQILTDGAWADLASVLVVCIESTMPLPEALRLSGGASACSGIRTIAAGSARRLEMGVPLYLAVADFQPLLMKAVLSGAETGDLARTVGQVASLLDDGVEMRLETLAGLAQPAITVLVTGFLGLMSILICLPVIRPVIPE